KMIRTSSQLKLLPTTPCVELSVCRHDRVDLHTRLQPPVKSGASSDTDPSDWMPGVKWARAREDLMDVRTMARYVRARTDLQIRASNSNHNSHCDLILLNDGSELFWISTV